MKNLFITFLLSSCPFFVNAKLTTTSCNEGPISCDSLVDYGSSVIIVNPKIDIGDEKALFRAFHNYSSVDTAEKKLAAHLLCRKLGYYTGDMLETQNSQKFFHRYKIVELGEVANDIGVIGVSDSPWWAIEKVRCEKESLNP